ncbi:maleylpyruvate isomerase family mycothiol-dependent enzyme [Kribbella sp. NPDC058245]|uniref:maleylpyruvate isomerase family mycothiol-dependent enzyme n=1 Tax=Kribbella sp. NPDC058245 TaxID=3346399 RepID=UPI0036E89F6B
MGWTIAHQIAHLAKADANVLIALKDPASFANVGTDADRDAEVGAGQPREVLLEQWRAGRAELAEALGELPADRAFPWFGSELNAQLMIPLRLMETWAHGQDIYDTLGIEHAPTSGLEHVAALGVAGGEMSFAVAQLAVPAEPIRIELTGPGGGSWGPEDAAQRIEGSALDFCLRVTHRRERAQTGLKAVGEDADKWLDVARVFL